MVSTSKGKAREIAKEDLDEILAFNASCQTTSYGMETPSKSLFSVKRQLAAEAEWLQDDSGEVQGEIKTHLDASGNPTRFDWTARAPSRVRRNIDPKDRPPALYIKRTRPRAQDNDKNIGWFEAIGNYSTKFMKLLALEEAEDEATLRNRLARWPVERLQQEGYCLTHMVAFWLQANQFGRPVATFSLGPGIKLPDHKFEGGMQVLLSRSDPLHETPIRGSIISRSAFHIRVCFPERFEELDEGEWRMDLGRPNLVYERMRAAISSLQYDPISLEEGSGGPAQQSILEGTYLRDVLLRSFQSASQSPSLATRDAIDANLQGRGPDKTPFEDMGAFRADMRIVSWARRYSRKEPLVMEGDPVLDNVNSSQTRAIAAMIGQKASLIQGPPGTGKTKTIIEAVKLLKVHFEVPHPILVCTYTNAAVDNLVEGLGKAGLNPLRVGFNGNVRQSLIHYSLDHKLQCHPLHPVLVDTTNDENKVSRQYEELEKKFVDLTKKLSEQLKPRKALIERAVKMKTSLKAMATRRKALKRKIFGTQQQMLRDVVADADVVCTTCVTAACAALNVIDFPVVFLDEASMSTEPASLIPIMKGSQHVALIGDHKQLPPVIVSKQAQADGLAMSLFERLTEEGVVPSVMLDMQYRMHPDISHFPSSEFYDLALTNGTVDNTGKVMPGLSPPNSKHLGRYFKTGHLPSVVFLDHTGNESVKGRSYLNVSEGHIVASIVEDLLLNNEHLRGQDIGIIAPYVGQIGLLTRFLNKDAKYQERFKEILGDQRAMQIEQIEIKTVDGFEGREKEVIIFSTVRNNPRGHIGFLADRRRLNVGLTRAKRGLFVVGSLQTLKAGQQTTIGGTGLAVVRLGEWGKGAESWHRYADFVTKKNLVVSLTGGNLERTLYGHLYPLLQAQHLDMEEAERMMLQQA